MPTADDTDTDTLDPALLRFALLLHAKAEGDDATYARVKGMTADEVADLAHGHASDFAEAWDESKHPRTDDGQFGKGGGKPPGEGAKPSKPAAPKAKAKKPKRPKWASDPHLGVALDAYDAAEGDEKKYLRFALQGLVNKDGTFEPDISIVANGDDEDFAAARVSVAASLVRRASEAATKGVPSERILSAARAMGAESHAQPGEVVGFDASLYDHQSGLFTGDKVTVIKPAWVLPEDDGGSLVLVKGTVAPAPGGKKFADNEAGHNPPHPGLVYDERSHRYHRPDSEGAGDDSDSDDSGYAGVADHPDVKGKPGVLGRVKGLAQAAQSRVNAFILKHEGAFNAVASVLGAAITTPDDIAKAPWLAGKFGANNAGEQGAGDAFGTATGVPGSVAAKVVATVLAKGLRKLGISFAEATGDVGQAAQLLAGLANAALDGTGVTVNAEEVRAWLADRLAGERTFADDHEGTWDESKHPRADNGQFGRGSGERSGSITGGDPQQLPKPKPKKSKADVEYATSNSRKQAEIDEVFRDVLGTDDAEEIASVVGAPDDATVSVDWVWKSDQSGKKAKIVVTHAAFTAVRYAYRTPKGNLVIQNDEFFVKPGHQGAGLGADVFAAQVENAIERGAYAIVCHAAKENPNNSDRPHNGYYTWPRFGYDQSLTDEAGIAEEDGPTFAACRERFPDAKTVLDVMASPEGRAWWKDNGTDLLNATFDLREGSRSRAILEAYKAERAERKKST